MAAIPVDQFKADLRKEALERRDLIPATTRQFASETVSLRPFPVPVAPGQIVSGYSPMKSEFSPLPLMRKLADAGVKLALPVVAGRGKPLVMRSWTFGEPLNAGVWGIREPGPDAAEVWPDVLLVPLAAFDNKGRRIGYGAGYYDLTINRLRVLNKSVVAVGLAFSAQQVPVVPATWRDARLDLVLTEAEVIDCRRK